MFSCVCPCVIPIRLGLLWTITNEIADSNIRVSKRSWILLKRYATWILLLTCTHRKFKLIIANHMCNHCATAMSGFCFYILLFSWKVSNSWASISVLIAVSVTYIYLRPMHEKLLEILNIVGKEHNMNFITYLYLYKVQVNHSQSITWCCSAHMKGPYDIAEIKENSCLSVILFFIFPFCQQCVSWFLTALVFVCPQAC